MKHPMASLSFWVRRPLSAGTGVVAALVLAYAVGLMVRGDRYVGALNFVDASTFLMIGLLLWRGIAALRDHRDLQAVSTSLVAALSFVFAYEALYKWSYYLAPFVQGMPPHELREFVIQLGTALTVLTGFADRRLRVGRRSLVCLALFALAWSFWMLVGYGQIFQKSGETMFRPPVWPLPMDHGAVYFVNRLTKVLLFLAYFFFFDRKRI